MTPMPARLRERLVAWTRRVIRTTTAPVGSPERGDVPGWVLVTVMTAGLVAMLWALIGPQLSAMVSRALGAVTGQP